MNNELEYDYVIVGSGAAGGTIFNELKKKNKNVLLVEEGGYLKDKNFNNKFYYALRDFWKSSGYQYAIGNISLPILQGVSVGGSTTINGSIMQKLDNYFCEKLIEETNSKNENFKFNNLLKYQEQIFQDLQIKRYGQEILENSLIKKFVEKQGWKCKSQLTAAPDYNISNEKLIGNSIENFFLRKFKGSDILNLVKVEKIIFEKKKILGINCHNKLLNKKIFIKVKKKLIVSCGVVSSAKLLMRSKIKNKNLGKNFSCHLSGAIDALFVNEKEIIDNSIAVEIETDDEICKKFANQNVPKEIILSRLPNNNIESFISQINKISSWVFNVSSTSDGYIKKNFFGYNLHYNMTNNEFQGIIKFIYKISEFLFNSGANEVFLNLVNRDVSLTNLIKIKKLLNNIKPKDLLLTSSHLFGTCCLGKDNNHGVVDDNFKVFNYDNLYVVDASIFPFPTKYNPQMTIMIFAKLASDIMLNE